jgi:hypothetical protein
MKRLLALLSGLVVFSLVPSGPYAQATKSVTEIKVRLLERLDTSESLAGRGFSATVEEPVRLSKRTVLAKGTTVKGTVTGVVSSGRLKRPASITLQLSGCRGDFGRHRGWGQRCHHRHSGWRWCWDRNGLRDGQARDCAAF